MKKEIFYSFCESFHLHSILMFYDGRTYTIAGIRNSHTPPHKQGLEKSISLAKMHVIQWIIFH